VGAGTTLARTDKTEYNADNTVSRRIQNYQDGVFSAGAPADDLITSYGYDDLGRLTWVKDVTGRYDVTEYDAKDRVAWTARTLTGSSGGMLPAPPPASSPAAPDANVATVYGYDGLGRTVLVTETGVLAGTFSLSTLQFRGATRRVTRTAYDALARPVMVTLNLRPGEPASPDWNVQTITQYDGAGNVIRARDGFGRWTYRPMMRSTAPSG
jgi:hypothetical protein